eukprot:3448142-Rhodomonas_salina.1
MDIAAENQLVDAMGDWVLSAVYYDLAENDPLRVYLHGKYKNLQPPMRDGNSYTRDEIIQIDLREEQERRDQKEAAAEHSWHDPRSLMGE